MKRVLTIIGLIVAAPFAAVVWLLLWAVRKLRGTAPQTTLELDADGTVIPFEDLPLRVKAEGHFVRVPGKALIEEVNDEGALVLSFHPAESLEAAASCATNASRLELALSMADTCLPGGVGSTREESTFVVVTRDGALDKARSVAGVIAHGAGVLVIQAIELGTADDRLRRGRLIIDSVVDVGLHPLLLQARDAEVNETLARLKAPDALTDCCRFKLVEARDAEAAGLLTVPFKAGLRWLCLVETRDVSSPVTADDARAASETVETLFAAAVQRVHRDALVLLKPVSPRVLRQHSSAGCSLLLPEFSSEVQARFPQSHLLAIVSNERLLVAEDSAEGLVELRSQLEREAEPMPFVTPARRPTRHVFRVRGEDWSVVE